MALPPPDLKRPGWLEFIRRNIWLLGFLAGALTLTGLRISGRLMYVPDAPEVMFQLPGDYALVDHQGRPFSPETMRGKVWIAGFVFTSCPSTCPAVTQAMADLRARIDRYGVDAEMVSFTVDPAHDTPQVLREYVQAGGLDDARWRWVTSDPSLPQNPAADVLRLVQDGFRLGVGERKAEADGPAYDIAHSTRLALIDGEGGVRGTYAIDAATGTDEIFERTQHVLRDMERAGR